MSGERREGRGRQRVTLGVTEDRGVSFSKQGPPRQVEKGGVADGK